MDTCQLNIPIEQQDKTQKIVVGGECPTPSLYEGATFTPHTEKINPNKIKLSWTNNRGLPNPSPVEIEAISGGFVAQPEPPTDTNALWIDTDDNSVDVTETNLPTWEGGKY